MFFISFAKTSACFLYVFQVATGLITSVPVNDLPFLGDVFILGYYQEFLHCVWTTVLLHMFLNLSLRPLKYGTTTKMLWSLL